MSNEAINWALKQRTGRSSSKAVLFVLANAASRHRSWAYPSMAFLIECTELDRKTVIVAMRELRKRGYITDTGERKGSTRQIIVYRLNLPEVVASEGSQERDGLETESSPKLEPKGPSPPRKGSRISAEHAQKRNSEASGTSKSNPQEAAQAAAPNSIELVLPPWMPALDWHRWCAHKGPIFGCIQQQARLNALAADVRDGHDPVRMIDLAIANGWKDLHAKSDTLIGEPLRKGEARQQATAVDRNAADRRERHRKFEDEVLRIQSLRNLNLIDSSEMDFQIAQQRAELIESSLEGRP